MTIRPSEIQITKESDASDLFTFQLDLTAEPTTSEGRHIGDCESKVFLQTRLLGDGSDGGIIIDYTPGPDDDLENYDWPGEYAQRFDGVDKGGDTFDFQPQLTTEPTETAKEMDRGSTLLTQFAINGNSPAETDIDDLAVDPNNSASGTLILLSDTALDRPAPEVGDEVLVGFEHGDPHRAYEGSHAIYQDIFIPPNAIEEFWV